MYIRTKDGRIAEVKENMAIKRCSENVLRLVYKDNQSICVLNGNDDIIDQSENLEELCDGYYMDKEGTEFTLADLLGKDCNDVLRRNITLLSNSKVIVKAFIKTDKGLIYVAKLNEKGELELI